jgi:predicted RNA-binding Zn ribbon-like protein
LLHGFGLLSVMEPLFLGAHPAADFLNTTLLQNGAPVELIGSGREFIEWLVAAQLLDGAVARKLERSLGTKALDAAAAEARRLRKWATDWLSRWISAPRGDFTAEVERLNELLQRAKTYSEVVSTRDGLQLSEHERIGSASELIVRVAKQIALLITIEDPRLLKRCAGSSCTLWFLDRTKAHRRLFCSPTACGNRAKVAAFRERQRGG